MALVRSSHGKPPRPRLCGSRLHVEQLEDRTVPTVTIAALGDSLTASHLPIAGRGLNWVDQLQALRSPDLTIINVASQVHSPVPVTSSVLLSGGQVAYAANLVAAGTVRDAVLEVGADDAAQFAASILAGNPQPFITEVVANIEAAAGALKAAGPVGLVVGNIPDIGLTPFFRAHVTSDPVQLAAMTSAIMQANDQIEAWAAARDVAVVDLFGLGELGRGPITLGGVQVNSLSGPDGLHPSTVWQGLLADTVLRALQVGDDVPTHHLRLSDQQILAAAGIPFPVTRKPTYYDVKPFVISPGDADRFDSAEDFTEISGLVPGPCSLAGLPARCLS